MIIDRANNAASVQTTDGTTATLVVAWTVPTDTIAILDLFLCGKAANGKPATARASQAVQNISGTVTLIGSAIGLLTFAQGSDATLTTCALSTAVSGTSVQLKVTGVAATTVNWDGHIITYVRS